MILRIWHGYTTPNDADAYQRVVDERVVPGIIDRGIRGLRSVDILRRRPDERDGEVEFVTIMTFDDWDAVESFAGPAATVSYVPDEARRLLSRFDEHAEHYELVSRQDAAP